MDSTLLEVLCCCATPTIPPPGLITINCFCDSQIFPRTFGSFPQSNVARYQFNFVPDTLLGFADVGDSMLQPGLLYSTKFAVDFQSMVDK